MAATLPRSHRRRLPWRAPLGEGGARHAEGGCSKTFADLGLMSPIYTESHWSAALAIAVSWKPTPVRSAIVIWRSFILPGFRPATIAPSSPCTSSAVSWAASIAWRSSPKAAHCARRSTTTRSARRRHSASSSCLPGESDPTALMCIPSCSHSARTSGSRAGVAVMSTSAAAHSSSTCPPRGHHSPRPASRRSTLRGGRLGTPRDDRDGISRTILRHWIWCRAWSPEPITPTVSIRVRASSSAATAPAAPVRMSVRYPLSSSNAAGSPVAASKTAINPEPLGSPVRRVVVET